MSKNPFLNALAALLYICMVASFMFFGQKHSGPVNSVVVPITVLSLFTLSAAIMGYIFLYQPAQLYLDGKKKQAVDLFVKTVAAFAGITFILFLLLYSGIIK